VCNQYELIKDNRPDLFCIKKVLAGRYCKTLLCPAQQARAVCSANGEKESRMHTDKRRWSHQSLPSVPRTESTRREMSKLKARTNFREMERGRYAMRGKVATIFVCRAGEATAFFYSKWTQSAASLF
jgi:hypothetical protein